MPLNLRTLRASGGNARISGEGRLQIHWGPLPKRELTLEERHEIEGALHDERGSHGSPEWIEFRRVHRFGGRPVRLADGRRGALARAGDFGVYVRVDGDEERVPIGAVLGLDTSPPPVVTQTILAL